MAQKSAIAADIQVSIPDYSTGVPGSELSVWHYRRHVDPKWQPGPDYPDIKAEPLPMRRTRMALETLQTVFRRREGEGKQDLVIDDCVVQAVGAGESVDLREYGTQRYIYPVFKDGKEVQPSRYEDVPFEQQTTVELASSLFLNTVHNCFARHYPLGIRPEALMWMVLHEVGVAVKQDPERYRHLFTDSAERKLIDVQVNGLDIHLTDQAEVWAEGVELLNRGLKSQLPSGILPHLLPEISTHDLNSMTASMVAVLDAASPFYGYMMRTCCGIPAIRLFGTGQDYDNIVTACAALSEVFAADLGDYFTHLLPVVKEIADTAAGRKPADNEFWKSIYNHYSGSGTDDMDGWITAFVNYEFASGTFRKKKAELFDWRANLTRNTQPNTWGRGINRDVMPDHVSSLPFIWNYGKDHTGAREGEFAGRNFKLDNNGTGANFDCRLVGGFLEVADEDGYATPKLGYAVLRGKELVTEVGKETFTVQAPGQPAIVAPIRSVFGAANPSGRVDVVKQKA